MGYPYWVRPGTSRNMLWAAHGNAGGNYTATDHPNSIEPLANAAGRGSTRLNAAGYTAIRLSASVQTASASANSPRLYVQYTTDTTGATGWTTIGAGTVASGGAISLAAATAYLATSWITLPGAAQADVLFRVVQDGGDGVADPAIKHFQVEFR